MTAVLQEAAPITVDVSSPPGQAARDISVDLVLGAFAMAGTFLLMAAVGCLLVGGIILLVKRWRDRPSAQHTTEPSHTRLRI